MAPGAPTCSTRRGAPGGGSYARPRPSLRPRPFIAPPLHRSPAPTEAPPRPVPSRPAQVEAAAPGAAVGARRGCGAVSALCCRAGRGAAAMAAPRYFVPPFRFVPGRFPPPLRSAPLRAAEGSRSVRVRRVPKFPAALRAGSGAAGRPALLPRCYRAVTALRGRPRPGTSGGALWPPVPAGGGSPGPAASPSRGRSGTAGGSR